MSAEQAAAFVLFSTVAAITPGPSNVMLTAAGAAAGMLRGLPCLLGVASGMASMMFFAALGLGTLILGHPPLVTVLKLGGSAFLLWLSWRIATAAAYGPAAAQSAVGFPAAFAFQWVNPKSWLVSVSAAGAYLQANGGALAQAFGFAALFFAAALPCGAVWLAFGSATRRLLGTPRLHRAFNILMGVLLAVSVAFIWRERP